MLYGNSWGHVRRPATAILSHAHGIFRLLGRFVIAAIKLPLVPALLSFALLYAFVLRSLLLHLQGTWEPAFPRAWLLWIAFLITLPLFAVSQLLWLGTSFWIGRRFGKRWKGTGQHTGEYTVLDGGDTTDEEEADWVQESHGGEHRSCYQRLPSLRTAWLVTQCALYAYIALAGYYSYKNYEHPADIRFRPALHKALAQHPPSRQGYARGEKIFIAAAFHQNEEVLPYWTQTMLDTITYLGSDNVFVSVVENYSTDRTSDLLLQFARELYGRGVPNRVLVHNETVRRPAEMAWNARIEFLSAIRNQALEPLRAQGGYDKVLFSNDVFVEPESIVELLETRDGDYDFACGLDFGHFGAYDMWVLRDRLGHLTAGIWPYFFDAAGYDAIKNEEPVPVFTCWNGIVVFPADPMVPVHLRSNRTLSTAPLATPPPPGHPRAKDLGPSPALTSPLAFRASAEGECYSSESFLLPYDFRRIMGLDRIYANPRVVTGYVWRYYAWHKWVLRERHVRWFVEKVWDGAWMQYARLVVGDPKQVWTWDGGDCHPWW